MPYIKYNIIHMKWQIIKNENNKKPIFLILYLNLNTKLLHFITSKFEFLKALSKLELKIG